MEEDSDISAIQDGTWFSKWLSRRERSLLQMPVSSIQADIIVSQDGSDTYKTIKNTPDDYLHEGQKVKIFTYLFILITLFLTFS